MKRGLVNVVTAVSQSEKGTCKGEPIRRQRTGGVSLASLSAIHKKGNKHDSTTISSLTFIPKPKIHISATHRANWEPRDESSGNSGSETREIHTPCVTQHREQQKITGESERSQERAKCLHKVNTIVNLQGISLLTLQRGHVLHRTMRRVKKHYSMLMITKTKYGKI